MIQSLVEAFVTLFVIIDPVGLVPIFIGLTRHYGAVHRRAIALKATWISFILLFVFDFVGDFILDALKISEAAFRIAGGLLLFLTAIDMVIAQHSGISSITDDEKADADQRADIAVFPLAIPFIAGPGGLASVVIMKQSFEGNFLLQAGFAFVLILVLLITYLCLRLSEPIARILGTTGANVVTRVFGLILAALSVQLILDGIRTSFNL